MGVFNSSVLTCQLHNVSGLGHRTYLKWFQNTPTFRQRLKQLDCVLLESGDLISSVS